MRVILISNSAFNYQGIFYQGLADELNRLSQHYPIAFVSNKPKPSWFDSHFNPNEVQFIQELGRQNGDIVKRLAVHYGVETHQVIVLAASQDDIRMGKNGNALIVAVGWATQQIVTTWGIKIDRADELGYMINLISNWDGEWWYLGIGNRYRVLALANLSSYGVSFQQQQLAPRLTRTVKNGGPHLNALLAITCGSLQGINVNDMPDLMWGVYPSSSSNNNDNEVLSEFAHRVRSTVSRVHFARRGSPLFIRHRPSVKRSNAKGSVDRTDPTDQIETIHLNPFYEDKINGRNVVVFDDCTTYGVSFGVAASFLFAAGALSVTGIALGKFGNQLLEYDININSNPFQPVRQGGYKIMGNNNFEPTVNPHSTTSLVDII